ncbi:MAG: hypothetical protein JOS17DRAFT_257316 [Linnemannia elongata]|nr:MAG: hypothetical protein JOS17DRAFT_257316 [Linnemannia elongata]
MRPTTTMPKRLLLPLILILALLSSSSTTTTDARAIFHKRTPDSNDDNSAHDTLIEIPPGRNPDHIRYPPGNNPGSFRTNSKRRKRSDTQLKVEAEAVEGTGTRIEKRNLVSQLLNTNRLHRRPGTHHLYNLKMNDETSSDTNGSGSGEAEEYSYWNIEEEDDEEEGIDEEDDLERHGGIYEGDDDEGFEVVGIVNQVLGGASTPIVIEPFIRHPAHGSSLFDTDINSGSSGNGNDRAGDHDKKSSNAEDSNGDDDEEDLERIRASQPWYQHQYPSSSSLKHHNDNNSNDNNSNDDNDILKSQIWIVDEWDEDFDDFIDWIDDLDHVRARPAGGEHSGNTFPLRRLFS